MKKVLSSPFVRYLILGLLAVVIGANIFALNANRLAGDAVPMPFGYGMSVVLSGSMEPTLSVGDLLIVREESHYEVGDMVVYQNGRIPVVHRIVSADGESFTTRGDANNTEDDPIPAAAVKGRVILTIPKVGSLLWFLKSPVATVVMLAAAILLVEVSFFSRKAEKESEKEKIKDEIRALMEDLKEN